MTNDPIDARQLLGDHVFLSNLRDFSGSGTKEGRDHDVDNTNQNTSNEDDAHQAKNQAKSGADVIPPSSTADNDDIAVGCAICLADYEVGDTICFSHNRRCAHHFHSACITEWLVDQQRVDCPCCRNNYLALSDDDEDDEDGHREGDVVGNVLSRQPIVVAPSSTPRANDSGFNRRHRNRHSRGSITRNPSATSIVVPAPPTDNSASTPTAGMGTLTTTSIRGEDPWTGVPLQFFDHQFSNALRPYRNVNRPSSNMQADSNSHEHVRIRQQERIQREYETYPADVDSTRSNNSSVYIEGDSRQTGDIEQNTEADSNGEDEADMWSCGPSAETEDDNFLWDDDLSRNLSLRPRWSRRRRRRGPQPTTTQDDSEQELSSANLGGSASVSLELSDLIVEGLMQRLEENHRSDDERSSRTESSGSVYLPGTADSNDEEMQLDQDERTERGSHVEPPCESSTDVCAICCREYSVNEELCWSQDPRCIHVFHKSCMDNWIVDHDECPFCASSWAQQVPANEDGTTDEYLLQVLQRIEGQANTMPMSIQHELEDGSVNSTELCNLNERIDRPNEGASPSYAQWIDEERAVAFDGDNSLGMSIGSWTATSDVVVESTAGMAETAAAHAIEDLTVIEQMVPNGVRSGGPNSFDTLDAQVGAEMASSRDQEAALFEEWGLVIDAFARMNERILNSPLDNVVSTKKTTPNGDEGFSGECQDVV